MTTIKAPERRRWTDTETGQPRTERIDDWILRGRDEMFKVEQKPIEPQFVFGYDIQRELLMELPYGTEPIAAILGMELAFDPGRDGWEIRFLTAAEAAQRAARRFARERRIYEAGGLG